MDWNQFYNGNPTTAVPSPSYQPLMRYEIIQVNGRAGAESFRMAPNSNALLLVTTASIIWFAKTDGAGYLTVTPYDFKPHEELPPINVNDLNERLKKIEDYIAQQQNNKASGKKSQPKESAST